LTPQQLDQIGLIVGAVMSLAVFSYLLGDNALYRIAIHVFIGAAAAFVLIVATESVLIPWINTWILAQPPDLPRIIFGLLPFLLGWLLLIKLTARFARFGVVAFAIVLGVGTAVALWGAIGGTLLPLVSAAASTFRPATLVEGLIMLVGTISVLVYFTYIGVRRPSGDVEQLLPVRLVGRLGQAFISITLGATYALLIISAISVLTGIVADRFMVFR
jgi:hypothetical protein